MAFFRGVRPARVDPAAGGGGRSLEVVSKGGGGGGGGGTVVETPEEGKTCFRDGPGSSLAPRSKDFASLLVGECLRLGAGNANCGGAVYLDDAFFLDL